MEIKLNQANLAGVFCDVLIVNLFEGIKTPGGGTGAVDKALDGLISSYVIEKEAFKGKLNQMYVLPTYGKIPADKVIIVGLGKSEEFNLNKVREVSAKAIRKAKSLKAKKVSSILHGAGIAGLDAFDCAQMITEGVIIGNYEFDKYKTKKEDDEKNGIELFEIIEIDSSKANDINAGIERGKVIGDAVNMARNLADEPACEVTPTKLAEVAKSISGIECKIYEKDELERMGMSAFLAVAQGSTQPPKFIHITYKPQGETRKKLAVVGKGLTFDSGGLDIKPANSMRTMKEDMSGAAATLGIMKAVSQIKPDVEVHGIIAACENMPSGKAYKPGDIIRAMNGKTIEIDNTDAEGRVTLADALHYAAQLNTDEIVDLATLTGAVVVALGQYASGIMGTNKELVDALKTSAEKGGERFWEMPFYDDFKDDIKSDVADIKNAGSKGAGSSTAGMFLREFVGNKNWAHIDIAGTAYIDKEIKELTKGATGAGVRAILNYILSI